MSFTLFQNFIEFSQNYWKNCINKGDFVIDATCGNGNDSLVLANLALTQDSGKLLCIDRQMQAIDATKHLLTTSLCPEFLNRVEFSCSCHSEIDAFAIKNSVSLIAYNLGYLPKSSKAITTCVESTKISVFKALELLKHQGLISIMCYPGHKEGANELEVLQEELTKLDPKIWACSFHNFVNRNASPCLFLIQKGS